MSHLQRFKFLALPFIMWTGIGMIAVLFLRWFLEYFTGLVQINQSIWNYWIPFAVAVLIWFLVLRKRFKLFYNPKWNNNQEMLIFMGINAFMAVTIMFSEFVMEYAYLSKQEISRVEEIDVADWNTCYDIEHLAWDTNFTHAYNIAEVTGRHNDRMHYYAYFVAPLNSSGYSSTMLWIGKEYHISFSNGESSSFKNRRWEEFHEESLAEFEKLEKGENEFLMPVQKSAELNHFNSAIERSPGLKSKHHRIFEFSSKDIHQSVNKNLKVVVISILLGLSVCFFTSLLAISDKRGLKSCLEGKYTITPDEREIRDIILLRGDYKVMAVISYLILFMYILTSARDGNLFTIQTATNFDYGAMQKLAFSEGEYWRLITGMFLHTGFLHIFGNLMLFVIFGLVMEPRIGHLRFLALILLSGLGAELVSYQVLDDETISLGASGIVFGLFGWYSIATWRYKLPEEHRTYLMFLAPIMLFNFFYGLATSNVNNAAHIGGFVTGAVLAFLIKPNSEK